MANNKNWHRTLFITKKCRKCGKIFIPAPMHRYRDGHEQGRWYCTWTCYNHRNDKEAVKNDQGTT